MPPPVCWTKAAVRRVEKIPSSLSFPISSSILRTKQAANWPRGVPAPLKKKNKRRKKRLEKKGRERRRWLPVKVGEFGKNSRSTIILKKISAILFNKKKKEKKRKKKWKGKGVKKRRKRYFFITLLDSCRELQRKMQHAKTCLSRLRQLLHLEIFEDTFVAKPPDRSLGSLMGTSKGVSEWWTFLKLMNLWI